MLCLWSRFAFFVLQHHRPGILLRKRLPPNPCLSQTHMCDAAGSVWYLYPHPTSILMAEKRA